MIVAISYDLKKPGQNYDSLYDAIRKLGVTWHGLESTWLVDTQLSTQQVAAMLRGHIDPNDYLLVVRASGPAAGMLPENSWSWITPRLG